MSRRNTPRRSRGHVRAEAGDLDYDLDDDLDRDLELDDDYDHGYDYDHDHDYDLRDAATEVIR